MNSEKSSFFFKTEIKKLLDIVINSLYKNKEVFIRELISNSSDAAKKLHFKSLTNHSLLEDNTKLEVNINVNKINKTITVEDNCIGMNKAEVLENLGTIAKSGTKDFIKRIENTVNNNTNELIGNFGIGFYSAFMVSNKVIVETRKAGDSIENGVYWESDGKEKFNIRNIKKETKGTSIKLYIKDNESEFLDYFKIESLVTKYSNYISLPITITSDKDKKEDSLVEDKKIINNKKSILRLDKKNISNKEYIEFYKNITNDINEPIFWFHSKVEGKLDYISLFYIPSKVTFDLFLNKYVSDFKLYVKNVFVSNNTSNFIPNYLRFIKGVVDITNLELNISRDVFQDTKTIENIKNILSKKILGVLNTLSKDNEKKYSIFWENFGKILKEGLSEDFINKEKILQLLRFSSSYSFDEKQSISLDEYITRMKLEQNDTIYYLLIKNLDLSKDSPHLEYFKKHNIEVLLLVDKIDEWIVNSLFDYKGKKFKSIITSDINIEANDINNDEYNNMINDMKNILKKDIKNIILSNKLTKYPSRIISNNTYINSQMEKILLMSGQTVPKKEYTLELNEKHKLIRILKNEKNKENFYKLTNMLFTQALLLDGKSLKNSSEFVNILNDYILRFHKK